MSHARAASRESSASVSSKSETEEGSDRESSASGTGGPNRLRIGGPAVRLGANTRSTFEVPDIQPKLTVNEPSDKYEREAERVADAVMRMSEPKEEEEPQERLLTDHIQRMCPQCQQRYRQGKPLDCQEGEAEWQRKESSGETTTVDGGYQQQIQSMGGDGRPLPDSVRSFFERRFGLDFGDVRVHTSSKVDDIARSIDAKAFTIGRDIAFSNGSYEPDSRRGKRLLAHELTHVVQQGQASVRDCVQRQNNGGGREEKNDGRSSGSRTLNVEFNAFIPGALGKWFPEPPAGEVRKMTDIYYCEAKTDERGFGEDGTSRIHKEGTVTVTSDGFEGVRSSQEVGVSHRRCETDKGGWDKQSAKASPGGSKSAEASRCQSEFNFIGAAPYPFVPGAPNIDFDVSASVVVEKIGDNSGVRVDFNGWHNAFPGYEGIVVINGTRHVVYRYMPEDKGPTPINLSASVALGKKSDDWFDVSPVPENCEWKAGAIRSLYSM